jgi:hypothetical protein
MALNARYLIENSVHKDGNRMRITTQLVQAENGANVWTESYDRELTSIFRTQEDISPRQARARYGCHWACSKVIALSPSCAAVWNFRDLNTGRDARRRF